MALRAHSRHYSAVMVYCWEENRSFLGALANTETEASSPFFPFLWPPVFQVCIILSNLPSTYVSMENTIEVFHSTSGGVYKGSRAHFTSKCQGPIQHPVQFSTRGGRWTHPRVGQARLGKKSSVGEDERLAVDALTGTTPSRTP